MGSGRLALLLEYELMTVTPLPSSIGLAGRVRLCLLAFACNGFWCADGTGIGSGGRWPTDGLGSGRGRGGPGGTLDVTLGWREGAWPSSLWATPTSERGADGGRGGTGQAIAY